MTAYVLTIDDHRLDIRDSVSLFASEEAAKRAAQEYHDAARVVHSLDTFGLDWRQDPNGILASDDVALSIDFFVKLCEVGK